MLKFVKSELQSRIVTLQYTPDEGKPVFNASKVILSVNNPFPKGEDGKAVWVNQLSPTNPSWMIVPTAQQIGSGMVFSIDSHKLGVTEGDSPYQSFRDGVINIDIYVAGDTITVSGAKGNPYVTGTGLQTVLENYDAILIGDEVYKLDKSKGTNGSQILFLLSDLKTDVTSAQIAVRDNLKLFNSFRSQCILSKVASILSSQTYFRPNNTERVNAVLKIITNLKASEIEFERREYQQADRLLRENVDIIKWLQVC